MEPREWAYYLLDEMGRSYRVENGLVLAKTQPKWLHNSPDGWQDINIGWERDLTLIGVVRNFTLPFGFVIDGQKILKSIFYGENIEKRIFLLIQKLNLFINPSKYYYFYKFFYRGELDLSTVSDEENKVTVSLMEGGLSKDLKANKASLYEIPVDEIVVKMDGVELVQHATFIILNGTLANDLGGHVVEMELIGAEQIQSLGAISTKRTVVANSADIFNTKQSFLQTGNSPTTIKINYDFGITLSLAGGVGAVPGTQYFFQLRGYDSGGTQTVFHNIVDFNPGDPLLLYTHHRFSGTATYTIPANTTLFIDSICSQNLNTTFYTYDNDNDFSIDYNFLYRTTYIKANKPRTLFNRLADKISPGAQTQSGLLDSKSNIAVTCGDAIRGLPGAVIKTSADQFINSYNVILNAGFGIEGKKYVFEGKEYFLNPANIIPLGLAKYPKTSVAAELMANTIKIGYPNQDYSEEGPDHPNGKQEYNTTSYYTSMVKRVVKELTLVSDYRADCFGAELVRINLSGKTTTDSSSDNDTFVLNVDIDHPQVLAVDTDGYPAGTVYYNLKRVVYDTITGVLSPLTVFNIEELTPARLINKHLSWLNSIFYGFEGHVLEYQTTDKNPLLYTKKGTSEFRENADVMISNSPRLFKPRIFEVTPEASTDIVSELDPSPNRCFSFIHTNGNIYNGFNLKIGIAANSLQEQAFTLLSTDNNDLTTLK